MVSAVVIAPLGGIDQYSDHVCRMTPRNRVLCVTDKVWVEDNVVFSFTASAWLLAGWILTD